MTDLRTDVDAASTDRTASVRPHVQLAVPVTVLTLRTRYRTPLHQSTQYTSIEFFVLNLILADLPFFKLKVKVHNFLPDNNLELKVENEE